MEKLKFEYRGETIEILKAQYSVANKTFGFKIIGAASFGIYSTEADALNRAKKLIDNKKTNHLTANNIEFKRLPKNKML